MNVLVNWIKESVGLTPGVQYKILASAAIVLSIWIVKRVIVSIVTKRLENLRSRYSWRKTSGYISVFLMIVFVGIIWIEGLKNIMTFFGILSAGLVLALKDPIMSLAAWLFIIWRRPFETGDRIQIGGYAGDVIDIRIFQFSLIEIGNWVDADQSTGRVIHVPNCLVFTEVTANYSAGLEYIWNEIPVLVTFESDWEKAKKILLEVVNGHVEELGRSAREQLNRMRGKFLIYFEKMSPTVYTSVKDSGVLLTIRYMCHPRARRDTSQKIYEDILRRFSERDDIEFAYPTKRFFYAPRGGTDAGTVLEGEKDGQ